MEEAVHGRVFLAEGILRATYLRNLTMTGGRASGETAYDRSADNAIVIWKECSSDRWHVVAMAGSSGFNRYRGSLLADRNFTGLSADSLESNDVLSNNPLSRIDFDLRISSPWHDGFGFTISCDAAVSMDASGSAGTTFLVGAGRSAVSPPFNLTDYAGCPP